MKRKKTIFSDQTPKSLYYSIIAMLAINMGLIALQIRNIIAYGGDLLFYAIIAYVSLLSYGLVFKRKWGVWLFSVFFWLQIVFTPFMVFQPRVFGERTLCSHIHIIILGIAWLAWWMFAYHVVRKHDSKFQ